MAVKWTMEHSKALNYKDVDVARTMANAIANDKHGGQGAIAVRCACGVWHVMRGPGEYLRIGS